MATKKENEQTFAGIFSDGKETPESIMAKVMWGQDTIMHLGKQQRITQKMVNAAMALLPYRLPRLNSVDATVKHVEVTHEEWLASMDDGGQADD